MDIYFRKRGNVQGTFFVLLLGMIAVIFTQNIADVLASLLRLPVLAEKSYLLAMVLYEALVFAFCLLLGFVQFGHLYSFLVSAVLSPVAVPIVYPIARSISAIGGESWKE